MNPRRAAVLVLCLALFGSPACALQTRGTGMDILLSDGTDTDMDPGQPEDAPADPFDEADSGTMEEAQEDAVQEVEDETGGGDGQAGEDAAEAPDLPGDEIEEAVEDPPGPEELPPECEGPVVGGFCWYASAVNFSCDFTCADHGGCSLAGTRYYAGSDGTDAHCIEVLGALGFGGYGHYIDGDNQFGCQFAWGIYTYWSIDFPTNCEDGCPGCAAQVVRMCACNE